MRQQSLRLAGSRIFTFELSGDRCSERLKAQAGREGRGEASFVTGIAKWGGVALAAPAIAGVVLLSLGDTLGRP